VRQTERIVGIISKLVPLEPPEDLVSYLQPRLESAMLFVAPSIFARFFIAAIAFPSLVEAAFLVAPDLNPLLPFLAPLVIVQLSPFLIIAIRIGQRKRAIETELPYIAMLFFILSHEAYANLPSTFRKIEQLGHEVFPAFFAEAQNLLRNLTYGMEGDLVGVEKSFRTHPSERLREFIHGYSTALVTGRDVHEFVRSESESLLASQEERWRSFSMRLSSLTEVSFMFLAVFPVGIQMIAGGVSGLRSSSILLLSVACLAFITVGLILWIDLSQPFTHDRPYPPSLFVLLIAFMTLVMTLYQAGLITSIIVAIFGLVASSAYAAHAHGYFRELATGEREVGLMLHDLAELAKAGAELPSALASLAEDAGRFKSINHSLAGFSRLLSLGQPPVSAQRRVVHSSWLVKVSFALLALSFETGGGYEQLDKLALSFRRVSDSKGAIKGAVLPFAFMGVIVPAISSASLWFLRSMQSLGPAFSFITIQGAGSGTGGSIIATSFLAGLIVSKAYSQSVRSMLGVPPLIGSALVSFLFFGSA
jgi:hypothetical protein